MKTDYSNDSRIVLTLDGGGTSFRFSATQGNRSIVETIILPSAGDNLDRCLANIVEGFERAKAQCPQPPVAISFAFPGPADYPNGVIGDLQHLPAFRGGVPLGPILKSASEFRFLSTTMAISSSMERRSPAFSPG